MRRLPNKAAIASEAAVTAAAASLSLLLLLLLSPSHHQISRYTNTQHKTGETALLFL
jgi:hypothetical protein